MSAVFPALTALEQCASPCSARSGRPSTSGARSARSRRSTRAPSSLTSVGLEADRDTLAVELPYGRKRALELDDARARSGDAAPRRADAGHGARGARAGGRAHPRRVPRPAPSCSSQAQPLGRAGPRHARDGARAARCSRRSYAEVSLRSGGPRGVHRSGAVTTPAAPGAAARRGPARVLRRVARPPRRRLRGGRWRARTLPRPERLGTHHHLKAILGLVGRRTGSVVVSGRGDGRYAHAPDHAARDRLLPGRARRLRASPPRRT